VAGTTELGSRKKMMTSFSSNGFLRRDDFLHKAAMTAIAKFNPDFPGVCQGPFSAKTGFFAYKSCQKYRSGKCLFKRFGACSRQTGKPPLLFKLTCSSHSNVNKQ